MPYELIKKIVLEDKPFPCNYCNHGWANYSSKEVLKCSDTCEIYKTWKEGGIVVPDGFDEVREIGEG